jgi:PAS domain S-box-containing protein
MIVKPDIQLIDAQLENLTALKEILTGQGYGVQTSTNGETALTEALELLPDLIVLNTQLPGLNGYQVCRRLKADDRTCNIPVLFICAPDETEFRLKTFDTGGADYILTPFFAGEVLARVSAQLARRQASLPMKTDPELEKRRKQAEVARRQSERKFRIIAEKLTDVIFLTDETGKITYISPATEAVFGFLPSEMIGHHFADFLSPSSVDIAVTAFTAALTDNIPTRNLKLKMKRKNGTVFCGELNGSVFRNGHSVGVLGLARDITEQQRVEGLLTARLRLVEFAQTHSTLELLRATLDEAEALTGSTIGFYHFLEADQVALSLQVWSSSTLAMGCCQIDGTELHRHLAEAGLWADCIRQRGPVTHNHLANLSNRKGVPAGHVEITRQLTVPVFSDDLITAVIGVGNKPDDYGDDDVAVITQLADLAWDIVERKRAEEKLHQLSQAVEQSPVSVVITNATGDIEYVNPKFTQVTGYTAAEVIGHNPRFLKSGEQSSQFYHELWGAITSGHEWRGELRNRKKNGQLFWEIANISPVRNAADEITHFVAVKEDITAQKQLEEQNRRQERLASVGQLAAGIAHDFNNLLMTIMGNAQLLQRQPETSEKNSQKLMRIVQQGERAAQLTRQILDFSRQSIREPRPLDLKVYLNETIKFIGRTIPERIQIQLDFEPADYTINADPTQLQQIITNLAVNARDAMPRGGTLYFSLARQSLFSSDIRPFPEIPPGEWIVINVTDTGSGISPEVLPHIFDPFFTTKKVGEGSGLGLAQVYGIVKQHEGYITVTSQVGQGTTFAIYLPALSAPGGHIADQFPDNIPSGQGETVLLVEDDQLVLSITQSMLESLNYNVLSAPDGQAALAVFQTHQAQIDLVLADVVMPNMDGFTLANHLQTSSPGVKVVLMSGYPIGQELVMEAKQKVSGWLQKPVILYQLAQTIQEALSQGTAV